MKSQFLRSDHCSINTNASSGYICELGEYRVNLGFSAANRFINVSSFESHFRTLTGWMNSIGGKSG
jgi:hypothetical protein